MSPSAPAGDRSGSISRRRLFQIGGAAATAALATACESGASSAATSASMATPPPASPRDSAGATPPTVPSTSESRTRAPAVTDAGLTPAAPGQPPVPTTVTGAGQIVGDGLLFSSPETTKRGNLITTATGEVVYWNPAPTGRAFGDLHVGAYQGRPVLAYFDGTGGGHYNGSWRLLDTSYHEVAVISAGNGQYADLHDLALLSDGTAIIECYNPVTMNLTAHGGKANATVFESVIQTVDIATGAIKSEWHSLDAFPVTETYAALTDAQVDYMHVNTLEPDPARPGSIVVSARLLCQVFELELATGRILWKLGGRHPTLTLQPGSISATTVDGQVLPFSYQHDSRLLADGTLRVFDNGDGRPTPYSVVSYFQLDIAAGTARELNGRRIRPTPDIRATVQGNAQEFSDGRTFVSWGNTGQAGMYDADRKPVTTIRGDQTYRMFLQTWDATPSTKPFAVLDPADRRTVAASWNGATGVAHWQLLTGATASTLAPAGTAPVAWAGLSTALTVPADAGYVAVGALDSTGATLETSDPISVAG